MNILNDNGLRYVWQKLKTIFIAKQEVLDLIYPVGSIYMNFNEISPSTLFGGNWERWAVGKTLIGVDENNVAFSSADLTGGEKTHTLSTDEIPAHTHGQVSLSGTVWNILSYRSASWNGGGVISRRASNENRSYGDSKSSSVDGFNVNASHTHDTQGSDGAHNNLQPYRTCYIWRRIS